MNRNYDYFVTRNVTPPWIAGQKLLKPWLGGGIASLIALSLNWGPSKQGGPEVEDPKTIKYHRVIQHETCIWTTGRSESHPSLSLLGFPHCQRCFQEVIPKSSL